MVSPHEKLAESLAVLRSLQERGVVAVRSADLTRTHLARLVKNGFLQEVMKGWYIPAHPDKATGESTAWYAAFWDELEPLSLAVTIEVTFPCKVACAVSL